ncbi:uncharacterized protein LOC135473131 [Liolophura sinensis]|uniref:uncharacterized protein LOC135473131 n=1 Tax=Liolophura sinensis TaxID=3198878 RepID=UPI0031597975
MDIPVELQAFVLTKLDGASLARAKRVCSLWKEAVSKLEVYGNIWMGCCLKEMAPEILCQLSGIHDLWEVTKVLDQRLSEMARTLPWTFWRDLYAKFYRTTYIKSCCSWQFKPLVLAPPNNQVATCLKLWGNMLLLGYKNGYVSVCEDVEKAVPEFSPLHHHGRQVTGLALVTASHKDGGPVLVSVSGGHDIQVTGLDRDTQCQLNYHSKAVYCASSWKDSFVTGAGDSILHGQPVWRIEAPMSVQRHIVVHEHLSERPPVQPMWANQVASGDDKGNVLLWNLHYPDEPTHLGCFNSKIRWIELRGKLLLWLTASGILYISTNCKSYRKLDVFGSIHRKPETMALRGPVFAVGTIAGFVHLYHVSSLRDWEELELGQADSVIKFDAEHVNALDHRGE